MINFRDAMAGGGALATVAALLIGGVAGDQAQPIGAGKDVIGLSGGAITAAEICERPETDVYLVTAPNGEQRYQARYEVLDADGVPVNGESRYDLTWLPGGTIVVVEETKGREFDQWHEQTLDGFWTACVAAKDVTPVEEAE